MQLPYIITVAHQKGGTGKTTTAVNLAVEFSKTHPVTLIDFDAQHLATFFNQRRDTPLPMAQIDGAEAFKEYVEDLEPRLYVIDVGGFDSTLTRYAMIAADLLITPVNTDYMEVASLMRSFTKIIHAVQQAGKPLRAKVLFSRVHPSAKHAIEEAKELVESKGEFFEVFDTVIRYRADYDRAYKQAKSVIEYRPYGDASMEMQQLIKEIDHGKI